jgi:hypothetical protein
MQTIATATVSEPFDLSPRAIERIAGDAGAEDANAARRILRAYWHSEERTARDAGLVDHAIRDVERMLQRELPHDLAVEISRAARQERKRLNECV